MDQCSVPPSPGVPSQSPKQNIPPAHTSLPPALLEVQSSFCTNNTVGTCSAELVCPYPPGIPLRVTGSPSGALAELHAMRDAGCSMTSGTDTELELSRLLQQWCKENQLVFFGSATVDPEDEARPRKAQRYN